MKKVIYIDGDYVICEDNQVWEYMSDPDFYSVEDVEEGDWL